MYSKFRKQSLPALIAFLLAAQMMIVNGQPSASAAAAPADDGRFKIVAVGDSLTAGYEYGFTEKSVPYGYVEHVYEQALFQGLRAEYGNFGVLGLKTPGLARWIEAVSEGESVTGDDIQSNLVDPRAERIFAESALLRTALTEADLIVMTTGGNDMTTIIAALDNKDRTDEENIAEAAVLLENTLNVYEEKLAAAIRTMAKLQPAAQIVVADQYLPIPAPLIIKDTIVELYPEANRQFLLNGQKLLKERLAGLITDLRNEDINVRTANISDPFAGNEMSYTSISKGDIHPNHAGYAAMGKAFASAIWDEYRTVKPREDGVPISVVINGSEYINMHKPLLVENRTFVPLREITEAMGADVKWNAASQTATIIQEGRTVDITIGASTLRINGAAHKLNAQPAFLHKIGKESKTYIPLAALSEGLEFQVVYRDTLKTAFINK